MFVHPKVLNSSTVRKVQEKWTHKLHISQQILIRSDLQGSEHTAQKSVDIASTKNWSSKTQ